MVSGLLCTITSVLPHAILDGTHPRPSSSLQSKKRGGEAAADQTNLPLGPRAMEGELVFGVAHIFASFNDTFVVREASPYT
jgi:hypothetical protein